MRTLFFALCLFASIDALAGAKKDTVVSINQLPADGYLLDKGWKFHAGDNADWAKPGIDDSDWGSIKPATDIYYLPQVRQAEIGWFQLKLLINPSIVNQSLAFNISQAGASEIYLNGKLIHRSGIASKDYREEKTQQTYGLPFTVKFDSGPTQIIAVRYSFNRKNFFVNYLAANPCLKLKLNDANRAFAHYQSDYEGSLLKEVVLITLYLLLGAMSLFLYFSFRVQKTYFYVGIYCVFSAFYSVFILLSTSLPALTASSVSLLRLCAHIFGLFLCEILLQGIYLVCNTRKNYSYWCFVFYAAFSVASLLFLYQFSAIICFSLYLIVYIEILRVLSVAIINRVRGPIYILFTTVLLVIILGAFFLYGLGVRNFQIAYTFGAIFLVIIPIGLSFFLASEFAGTGRALQARVVEVEQLSQKNILQEKEKRRLLAIQNETLEQQVTERTAELNQSLTDLKATQSQLIQREKMASLGELTTGIAHEIQNPLNFVNNFSEVSIELLEELKAESEKQKEERDGQLELELINDVIANTHKINHHGKRADLIVKGMLEHSQTSTGQKEPTDINKLAGEYLKLAYNGLMAKDKNFNAVPIAIGMVTSFDPSLPKINVVPQDIGRVLLNLFNNAFYAVNQKAKTVGPDYKPTVEVTTFTPSSGGWGVTVKDNGTGIPDAIKDKIMQPFFTTKPAGEGTGLGLSLSYDIVVKGHGGSITVDTKEGEYTTFTIYLPLT